MDGLAQRIRKARRDRGLSQVQLAALIGTMQSRVSALENGARGPSVDTLARIADATGADGHWLLTGKIRP